jgi:hypothetical protein
MIATDQDMSGGAHSDHHPLMTGLEPNTLYHYRVQGAAAGGTIYVGEDRTFRTVKTKGRVEMNLASLEQGARVRRVSSNWGGADNEDSWGANSALDGKRGTAWSSNGDGGEAFIEIEFRSRVQLRAVEVWTRSMSDGTAIIKSFTLTTDRGERFGPFRLESDRKTYRFEIDAVTRTLRLDVADSTGGNTGLVELAAYGEFLKE